MRKIFKTVAALAVVIFASCTNELMNENNAPIDSETTVVGVGFVESKTYLGDLVDGARKVYWSEGDKIAINGNESTEIAISENKNFAEFTFAGTLDYPYSVLYPESAYVDASTISLPAVQAAADGTFATNCAPMSCVAQEGEPIALHHLTSVVRLQVKLPSESEHAAHKLAKIEFRGKAGEQVSGQFAIDYAAATLAATSTADADKVVTTRVDKSLSNDAIDVFVVVPAGEYTEGFSVRFIDNKGHYMDIATNTITLTKGDIKSMPVVEFAPTGTLVGVEIASAEDLVAFAKAFNSGEYDNVSPLVVTLKNDIVFDDATNAAWTSIGSVEYEAEGAVNRRFDGSFYGQGSAIKNWHSTNKPLFATTNGGIIKDLVIDSSSSMTFSLNIIAESHYGVIIGDAFSTVIENCTNKAPVILDNCVANGLATRLDVGGIVGRTDSDSQIIGCTNEGTIESKNTCNFGLTAEGKGPKATVYIGGICGYCRCSIIDCSNTGDITSNYNAYEKATAGIVARIVNAADNTVKNCTNSGNIIDNSSRTPVDTDISKLDYNREIYVSGVSAIQASSTIDNCSNSGSITLGTNVKIVYVGGVVGKTNHPMTVLSNLTNSGEIKSTAGVRYLYMGGVIGHCSVYTISDLINEGALYVTCIENSGKNTTMDLGGVIGLFDNSNAGTIDGTSNYNIVNRARVDFSYTTLIEYVYLSAGGVIGRLSAPATVKYIKNEADLVKFGANTGTNMNLTNYCGGIIGVASAAGTTIENCISSARVYNASRGTLLPDDSSLPCQSGQGFFCGGIAAYIMGDADNRSAIRNCQNTAPDGSNLNVYVNRGYGGGIVAYARYTDISNSTSTATMRGINTSIRLGGIAAYLNNSNINNCTATSTKLQSNNNTFIGGIASHVNAGSAVKNSTFNGIITKSSTYQPSGMVAAKVVEGATIENCGVAGSIFGTAITADNFSNYLIGETSITPTGCYYLTE